MGGGGARECDWEWCEIRKGRGVVARRCGYGSRTQSEVFESGESAASEIIDSQPVAGPLNCSLYQASCLIMQSYHSQQ
jgi:hypothetical protein